MSFRGKLYIAVFAVIFAFVALCAALLYLNSLSLSLSHLENQTEDALYRLYKLNNDTNSILVAEVPLKTLHDNLVQSRDDFQSALDALSKNPYLKYLSLGMQNRAAAAENLWNNVTKLPLNDVINSSNDLIKSAGSFVSGGGFLRNYYTRLDINTAPPALIMQTNLLTTGVERFTIAGDTFNSVLTELATGVKAQVERITSVGIAVAALLVLVIVAGAALFVFVFAGRVAHRVRQIEAAMGRVAEKDLTNRTNDKTADEIGTLSRHTNEVLDILLDFLKRVQNSVRTMMSLRSNLVEGTESTGSAVNQISESIDSMQKQIVLLNSTISRSVDEVLVVARQVADLSDNIESQNRAVAATSASIEEMTVSIQNVAKVSEERRERSEELMQIVRDGEEKVATTNEVIRSVAKEISQILEVIDIINSISDQTNLLSMNAAIESAHAGDAGKGFAVVADEIHKLAESTSQNASAIGKSLKSITEKMEQATVGSDASQHALEAISSDMGTFVNALAEILSSMEELSAGSSGILNATSEVSEITSSIRQSSQQMRTHAASIEESMRRVREISESVASQIQEIDAAAKSVLGVVGALRNVSRETTGRIEDLSLATSLFKTG